MKACKKLSMFTLAMVCCVSSIVAQKGKLLLIGGGSERDTPTGWSNTAYQWAVNQSANKKVAIINSDATFTPSTFLSTYFTQSLGALAAKDFTFGSYTAANQASVYDSLMKYDVIFFRGGDQSRYYLQYKGTELERAVKDKYTQGGVLAGTSAGLHVLSGIIYTAINSSIRSDGAIANISSTDITLNNDFIGVFPGYVFDSHFHERGRFGRLISFMARWKSDRNENIKGIGVDDLTAMGIDSNGVGTVFGTGAACIYQSVAKKTQPFFGTAKLLTDSISVRHILNGWKYHFKKDSVAMSSAGISQSAPLPFPTNQNNTVYFSGADGLSQNSVLLNLISSAPGACIILTSIDTTLAVDFKNRLGELGKSSVSILPIPLPSTNEITWKQRIENTYCFLFLNTKLADIQSAFTNDSIGKQLKRKFDEGGNRLAFVGGNSRWAGKRALGDNYLTSDAAYTNTLRTTEGLGFVPNTIIFPNTFNSEATGENGYSGVNYALLKDSLAVGCWLHGDMVGIYQVKPNGNAEISSIGAIPLLLMQHHGTSYAFNTKTSRGDGTQQPRQVSGFVQMLLSAVDTANPQVIARNMTYVAPKVSAIEPIEYQAFPVNIFPNPCTQSLSFASETPISQWTILGTHGQILFESNEINGNIPTENLSPGMYLVRFMTKNKVNTLKFSKTAP